MPKSSPIQADFSGGEVGPHSDGKVDAEKVLSGLKKAYNYIPTIEGPLVRRPGDKYVVNIKDPSKPPSFIEFKFSDTQQYMLEFGDKYIRFYANNGQVVTSQALTHISNAKKAINETINGFPFNATRVVNQELAGEDFTGSVGSAVVSGAILELQSPYSWEEAQGLKYAQKDDTLILVCSSRPMHIMQRRSADEWEIGHLKTKDGPYLPLNSYLNIGDSAHIHLAVKWIGAPSVNINDHRLVFNTGPRNLISTITAINTSTIEIRTVGSHPYKSGQRVFVAGVVGTVEANNSSLIGAESWPIRVVSSSAFQLIGPTYVNNYAGSGVVYPALLTDSETLKDNRRNMGIISNSTRYWGYVINTGGDNTPSIGTTRDPYEVNGFTPASFQMVFDRDSALNSSVLTDSSNIIGWYLGVFNSSLAVGYPQGVTFHQDRLVLAGAPGYPSQFDASRTGLYDDFGRSKQY